MKKAVHKLFAGLALAGMVFSAQAADINRSFTIDVSAGTASFGDTFLAADSGKSFLDKFSFNVLSQSDVDSALTSIATLTKFDLALDNFKLFFGGNLVSSGSQVSSGNLDVWSLTAPNLASGNYTLAVEGRVLGTKGGSFGGNINVSPVPEPSTWAMMVGGLAALGFMARRRKTGGFAA